MKKGEVLSEISFYVVDKVLPNGSIEVIDDYGNEITLGKEYVESGLLSSAEGFTSTEEKTATELAEIFLQNQRVAMSVEFYKKDTPKTKTQMKKEVSEWTEKVRTEFMNKGISAIEKYATEPVLPYTPGELRVMKGRHYGTPDEFGRVHFIDMEQVKGNNPAHDARTRQVDPRTLVSVIVNGVKYVLKKK